MGKYNVVIYIGNICVDGMKESNYVFLSEGSYHSEDMVLLAIIDEATRFTAKACMACCDT